MHNTLSYAWSHENPLALPMERFLAARMDALALSPAELVRRWGYDNVSRGRRRLDAMALGQFTPDSDKLARLAVALEVSQARVCHVWQETLDACARRKAEEEAREWQAWCAAFVPHAICRTERTIPSPIFVAGLIGVDRILRLKFDASLPRERWVAAVVEKLPPAVVAFGAVTGFVLNYAPDEAVAYDRDGRPLAYLDRALRPGRATLSVGGREFSGVVQVVGVGEENT